MSVALPSFMRKARMCVVRLAYHLLNLNRRLKYTLLHKITVKKKRKRAENEDSEYSRRRLAFRGLSADQLTCYCHFCETQLNTELDLREHLMTDAHVKARDQRLERGMTPGGLVAPADENFQSVQTEILELYSFVNRMISQGVPQVMQLHVSEELRKEIFQKAPPLEEDIAQILYQRANEAVDATRGIVQRNQNAVFLESSRKEPGSLRLQRQRLEKREKRYI